MDEDSNEYYNMITLIDMKVKQISAGESHTLILLCISVPLF